MNNQLVVNWHMLEACNFSCRYCFAHWPPSNKPTTEIWKTPRYWEKLLAELSQLPHILTGEWTGIRLNIAGGEPMLLWKKGYLDKVLTTADNMGFQLSIISNGYLISDEFIKKWAPNLQIIGISMDSAGIDTNIKIGRCTVSKTQISPQRIAEIFSLSRDINPTIECKLNTVVNTNNWREDMHPVIEEVAPDRWKVFKMLPLADTLKISNKQAPFVITDKEFECFLDRHDNLRHIMSPENNDAMTESYLMVDPLGRFYQNEPSTGGYRHTVSDPVHEIGALKAIRQITFKEEKFHQRYIPVYNTEEYGRRANK